MKNQALFSLKDTSKKIKCCVLQLLFGSLKVKLSQSASLMLKFKFLAPLYKGQLILI